MPVSVYVLAYVAGSGVTGLLSDSNENRHVVKYSRRRTVKKNVNRWDALFLVCFVLGGALVLYKCRYGFANVDESFYLTVPYRLTMGDGLFINEWHLSQMAGFLLYPFMLLHRMIFPTMDGVVLHFRYLYTVVQLAVSLFLYLRTRRFGQAGAIAASISYLLFAPFGIMALSYNSMGVGALVVCGVLLSTNDKGSLYIYGIAGLFFACAVLCCPYLVGVYAIYAVGAVIWAQRSHNQRELWKGLAAITGGCALLAVIFFAFVFSRCSLTQFLHTLPQILQDPEHPPTTLLQATRTYVRAILDSNGFAPICVAGCGALGIVALVDGNSPKRKKWYLTAAFVLAGLYLIPFFTTNVYINYLMFPPALVGFVAFCLYPQKNLPFFLWLWLPGILYGFCINWTSNQGFYVISMAATICTVASWLMIENCVKAMGPGWDANRWLAVVCCACMAGFIAVEGLVRYESLFWEHGSMSQMTHLVTVGPGAGIYSSPSAAQMYESLYYDTQSIREETEGNILYYSKYTYLFLADSKGSAAYSAWLSGVNDSSYQKLLRYYELNPDKIPSYIYCLKDDPWIQEHVHQVADQYGYDILELELGYLLVS